jgi:glycosyltransferase involved in cell wall biosynthesis
VNFSALVLSQDEEIQIEGCLRSLVPAARVVVLDSGSTDRTLEIARGFERVEIVSRPFSSFADQRNFGLRRFTPDAWVLHLDADERLTPGLAAELQALEPPAEAVAYNLAGLVFIQGRPVPRASGFPVYQTRLTKAAAFEFEQVGHGQKAPAALGALPRLRAAYEHHPFEKGFEHWRARHERYAEQEAQELVGGGPGPSLGQALRDPIARRQWLKHATARLPFRPTLVWLYLLFVRGGIREGAPGREFCRRRRLYERLVVRRARRSRGARGVDWPTDPSSPAGRSSSG